MQPTDIAIALRRRTPWEAMDLGLAMLQRWWRQTYAPHLVVGAAAALAGCAAAAWYGKAWLALALVWWLKPLYDRVVLHVLSRAVFGEVQTPRHALGAWREWLATGLPMALSFGRLDTARSFNLPVRQLEGQRGRPARERRSVLGRRVSSYATWLTFVCVNFELVLYWSLGRLGSLFLPAKALEGRDFTAAFLAGDLFGHDDVLAYVAAVLLLEPFYVAAGFALYLNRRTLLEGWGSRTYLATSLADALRLDPDTLSRLDLMIVDFHLDADADGLRCIEVLRQHCGAPLPAIVITADRSADIRAAVAARGLHMLNKPIKPAVLRALISPVIATQQAAE